MKRFAPPIFLLRELVGLFSVSTICAAGLTWDSRLGNSIFAISFVSFTTILYFQASKKLVSLTNKSSETSSAVWLTIVVPLGLIFAALIFNQSESFFWVPDSKATHVPQALKFANAFRGNAPLQLSDLEKPGVLTHAWVGLWFAIFTAGPITSSIALLTIKVGTAITLGRFGKVWFDSPKMYYVFIPYLAVSTVLLHTAVFYKEAAIHLAVALFLLGASKMEKNPGLIPASIALSGLGIASLERFYVGALLFPLLIVLVAYASWKRAWPAAFLMGTACYLAYNLNPYMQFSPEKMLLTLEEFRSSHAAIEGIRQSINYDIPYWLAIVKFYFTPIFHPDKLEMFKGLSAIFTWGSFVHNLAMCAFALGFVRSLIFAPAKPIAKHILAIIPFVLLLLAGAYISPWAGRVRDSFYPMVSAYAFFYLTTFAKRDCDLVLNWFRQRVRS